MVLARGPGKHIPCLALQVARIMLFSGSHNRYEKLWARQLRMLPSVAKASFTCGYYAGLAQQCTAVDSQYASKRAPNLHLVTSGKWQGTPRYQEKGLYLSMTLLRDFWH